MNESNAFAFGWLVGSQEFVARIKQRIKTPKYGDEVPAARRLAGISLSEVLNHTADDFGVDMTSFAKRHSRRHVLLPWRPTVRRNTVQDSATLHVAHIILSKPRRSKNLL